MGFAVVGGLALVWFGGRRLIAASRQGLRRIIREELASLQTPPKA
jgi:hypothetical protein